MSAFVETPRLDLFANDRVLLGDFFDMFCGDFLGKGTRRAVYEYRLNPDWVVKIEGKTAEDYFLFDNVSEWELYHAMTYYGYKDVQKFLAPVRFLSKCGRVLIQDKTTPITKETKLPKLIPSVFSDTKTQNWGVLNGKVVCHDYANNSAMNVKKAMKMIKAKWWSDNFYQCPGVK